jgi:hypothetical protein
MKNLKFKIKQADDKLNFAERLEERVKMAKAKENFQIIIEDHPNDVLNHKLSTGDLEISPTA